MNNNINIIEVKNVTKDFKALNMPKKIQIERKMAIINRLIKKIEGGLATREG